MLRIRNLEAGYGGLMVLKAGTSDVVRVTVRDDISLGGTNYLKCFVYGLKDQ